MNLGLPEMIFIFLLALIIFGPKKLPEIGKQIGKAMNEFKRASNEFKSQIEGEIRNLELEETLKKQSSPQILPPQNTVPLTASAGESTENLSPASASSGEMMETPQPVSPDPGDTRVGQPADGEVNSAATADGGGMNSAAKQAAKNG